MPLLFSYLNNYLLNIVIYLMIFASQKPMAGSPVRWPSASRFARHLHLDASLLVGILCVFSNFRMPCRFFAPLVSSALCHHHFVSSFRKNRGGVIRLPKEFQSYFLFSPDFEVTFQARFGT